MPSDDGEITVYTPRTHQGPSRFAAQPLVYVNGMATPPEKHADAAVRFATEFNHTVIGFYNQVGADFTLSVDAFLKRFKLVLNGIPMPDALRGPLNAVFSKYVAAAETANTVASFLADISQCINDYTSPARTVVAKGVAGTPHGLRVGVVAAERAMLQSALGPVIGTYVGNHVAAATDAAIGSMASAINWGGTKQALKFALAKRVIGDNKAALALLEKLHEWQAGAGIIRIICHSQGNLIVSMVLNLLHWILEEKLQSEFHVFGLASPVSPVGWPSRMKGFTLRLYTNEQDPVTYLSLGASYGKQEDDRHVFNGGKGFGFASHMVELYTDQTQFISDVRRDLGWPPEHPRH